MLKKYLIISLFLLALVIGSVPVASALKSASRDTVNVPKDEVVGENYFVAASRLTIDGDIDGDLICAAEKVVVNGDISGSVLCFASEMEINGNVQDNVRVGAEFLTINGNIGKNLMGFIAQLRTSENAHIGKDVQVVAPLMEIGGKIGRDLEAYSNDLMLSGEVGRNVNLRIDAAQEQAREAFLMTDSAKIGGSLNYSAYRPAMIEDESGISGNINYSQITFAEVEKTESHYAFSFWSFTRSLLGALVIGLIIVAVWSRHLKILLQRLNSNIVKTIVAGCIFLFVVPFAVIFVMLTLIGIPLGMIVIVFWAVSLYLAKILFGIYIGEKLLPYIYKEKKNSLVWMTFIGITIIWIASLIPILGFVVKLCAIIWGMGSIWHLIEMSAGKGENKGVTAKIS